jgi:hypothetical protein
MRDFSDTHSQFQRWQYIYKYAKRILPAFRVQLGCDNSIVGLIPEDFVGSAEEFDLLFCTPDFEARAVERMHAV